MKLSQRILKALDYIFVLRPILFFPGITTLLAGYYLSDIPLDYTLINIIFAFCMLMGSTFILNQLEDIDSDKNNSKLFLIEHGFISKNMAILESVILALVAFGIAFSTDLTTGFIFIGFFVITGIVYNLKPFQWKNYPWLGLLANLLMGVAAFTTGWLITSFFEIDLFIYLIQYPRKCLYY